MNLQQHESEETKLWSEWVKNNSPDTFKESTALHRAWLKKLHNEVFSILYQNSIRLKRPHIIIDNSISRWGMWNSLTRTIHISRWLMISCDWDSIVETLKHELAHMLALELFTGENESPHGKSFKKACEILGVSKKASSPAADTGLPLSLQKKNDVHIAKIQKIKKLLNLSLSQNKHEAELAVLHANKLLLKYNLDKSDITDTTELQYKYIGSFKKRFPVEEVLILNILSEFFLVDYIIVPVYFPQEDKELMAAEIYGFKENIEFAEYVYSFLMNNSALEWKTYKEKHQLKGISVKKSFLTGYLHGFRNSLIPQTEQKSYALILNKSRKDIKSFIKKRYPSVRSSSRKGTSIKPGIYNDAHSKGKNLTINNPITKLKRFLISGK